MNSCPYCQVGQGRDCICERSASEVYAPLCIALLSAVAILLLIVWMHYA